MPDKILHKRSLTPGSIPTTSSLEVGELAINVADGKLYVRRSGSVGNDILSLVTANTVTTGSIQATSFSGSFSGSGANLFNIPASGIVGLNLSQIASGSATASISPNTGFQINTDTSITGSLTASNAFIPGNITVLGTASINTLVVNQTKFSSGSNQLGDGPEDTQILFGTVRIPTGPLTVTGSSFMTGSLTVTGGITGSLFGTSSLALTASYVNPLTQSLLITGSVSINTTSSKFDVTVKDSGRIGSDFASDSFIQFGNAIAISPGYNTYTLRNLAVGVGDLSARLGVRGSGTTSATTAFRVENSNNSYNFSIRDDGNLITTSNFITISSYDTTINGSNKVTINGTNFGTGNIYRAVSTGFLTLGNDSTVASGITLYGSTHSTLPNVIRVTQSGSTIITVVSASVGIGTTTPSSTLDVSGSARITNGLTVTGSTVLTGSLTVTGSISSTSGITGSLFGTASFASTASYVNPLTQDVLITGSTFISSSNATQLQVGNNSLFVSGSGNIGIGTTTPSASLHISGSTTGNLLLVSSPSSSNMLYVSSSGTTVLQASTVSTAQRNALEIKSLSGANVIQLRNNGTAVFNDSINTPYLGGPSGRILAPVSIRFGGDFSGVPSARVHIKGSGTTSATTTLLVENANASASLTITDDLDSRFFGNVGIGTAPSASLDVSGSGRFTNSLTVTGSFTVTTGSLVEFQVTNTGTKLGNSPTDTHTITGSVFISSSFSTSSAALSAYKSGSTVLDIQGSQGQLFSVVDSLTGSLMSVNDISGLPILEVFSDDRVVMGTYGAPALIITGSNSIFSGSVNITGSLQVTGPTLFRSSATTLSNGAAQFNISHSLIQTAVTNSVMDAVRITPTLQTTATNQVQTALKVQPTFTGSFTGSQNIIADFGSSGIGSQLTINDSTSGSIYQINDISGLPIVDVTSDSSVRIYNFPQTIFEKTGSQVNIYGMLNATGSFVLPLSQSATPVTGSAYWSGSLLFIYDGTRYRSSSFA